MPEPTPAKKTAAKKTTSSSSATEPSTWEKLTAPFPEDWVEKLPKALSRDDRDKGRCQEGGRVSADGHYCGGWHARSVHLDYVGHAGITMRLNDVLGPGGWDFQPMAYGPEGLPLISRDAFWAKLSVTVDGETVTKWELATNFNGPQEALGDALRRCAMRLGLGTYLWSKSDHAFNMAKTQDDHEPEAQRPGDRDAGDYSPPVGGGQRQGPPTTDQEPVHVVMARDLIRGLTDAERAVIGPWWDTAASQGQLPAKENLGALTPAQVTWLEEVVENVRERARQAAQEAQESPQDPQ